MFAKYDKDGNGIISFDEFIEACHSIIKKSTMETLPAEAKSFDVVEHGFANSAMLTANEGEENEEEEVPQDIAHLPADEQQSAIKKKAFTMLGFGTLLVLLFSGMIAFAVIRLLFLYFSINLWTQ